MIDNIILLITGTLHQRQIAELRSKCHPLGSFEEMESVNIANTPAELYEAVLVDTPLGGCYQTLHEGKLVKFCIVAPYFKSCISQTDLDELNIELIRNALYKVCVTQSLHTQHCYQQFFEFRHTWKTSINFAKTWTPLLQK